MQLHGIMLRRTKDEVLDLPPKLRTWLPVQVAEGTGRRETRKVLELLLAGSIERARGRVESNRKGRTVAQGRVQLLAALTKARRQIAVAKAGTTIEFLEGVVAQGEKAIVFSGFDEPVRKIATHFGKQAVLLT